MSASQLLSAGSSKLSRPRRSPSPTVPQLTSTSDHLPTQPGVPSAPSSASPRSHSDSASSSLRASVPWPLSDPKLCLFFDPFSVRAAEVRTGLESLLKLSGSKLNTASVVQSATHLVLDPAEELNRSLRARAGQTVRGREDEDVKQRVVTLDWAKSSFFAGRGLPEEEFGIDDSGGEPRAGPDVKVAGKVEEEPFDAWGRRASEYVNGNNNHGLRAWLVEEEEDWAQWLASDPQNRSREDGGSIADQYARSHPKRSASSWNEHYKARQSEIDRRVRAIRQAANGQRVIYVHSKVAESPAETETTQLKLGSPALAKGRMRLYSERKDGPDSSDESADDESNDDASSSDSGPDEPKPACFNCASTTPSKWRRINGKRACPTCAVLNNKHEQRKPGSGALALARRKENVQAGFGGRGQWQRKSRLRKGTVSSLNSDSDDDNDDIPLRLTHPVARNTRSQPSHPSTSTQRLSKRVRTQPKRFTPPPPPPPPPQAVASGSGTSQYHHHHHQASVPPSSSASTSFFSRPNTHTSAATPYPQPPPLHANPPQLAPADQKCHFCWHTGAGPYVDLPFANGVHVACEGCAEWYEVEVQTALLTGGSVEDVTRRNEEEEGQGKSGGLR